jgi:uncharacterized protein YecE (DUF72 family)
MALRAVARRILPRELTQKKELNFASRELTSIEINGTFYSLQRPSSFEQWVAETPDDFVFAVKGPRYITHIRRLREVEAPLANFLASGVLLLGKKLGPILWQFPPNFTCDLEKKESFLMLLPKNTAEANHIAENRDRWLNKRVAFDKTGESRLVPRDEITTKFHHTRFYRTFMQIQRRDCLR